MARCNVSFDVAVEKCILEKIRESSFNMTRGGDEDIEGGLRKFLDTRRGGGLKKLLR